MKSKKALLKSKIPEGTGREHSVVPDCVLISPDEGYQCAKLLRVFLFLLSIYLFIY